MAGLTINNPIDLQMALKSRHVLPGDTLVLLPGTYKGNFVSELNGTVVNPINIKPLNPGTVIIDGSLSFSGGGNVIITGLEFTNTSWTTRSFTTPPSTLPNVSVTSTPGIKIRNCIIHDGNICVAAFGGGLVELYGCLMYNGGLLLNGSGYAHTMYTHNDAGTYTLIEDNIFLASFNYGFHAHSSGLNDIDNYDLKDNIFGKCNGKNTFGNDSGLDTKVKRIVFRNNENMNTWWWFNRWTTPIGDDITISGNWFDGSNVNAEGCYQIKVFKTITNVNNTHVYPGQLAILKCPDTISNYNIDNNTYYGEGQGKFSLLRPGNTDYEILSWSQWQNALSGLDSNSTFRVDTPSNRIRLIPNKYDSKRANLAVYNYDLSESLSIDVSAVYNNGDVIKAHQSQDYFNDIQSLTVVNGHVNIDMRAQVHTVVKPIGHSSALDTLMCPKYGAFILELA